MYKGLAVRLPDGRHGEVLQAHPNGTCSIALGEMDESDNLQLLGDHARVEQVCFPHPRYFSCSPWGCSLCISCPQDMITQLQP